VPKPPTLLQIAAARVGVIRAYRVVAFMVEWSMARRALGQETLTVEEFAEWWRIHVRTAYREQARFREAFPDETTPDRLVDHALTVWDERTGIDGLAHLRFSRTVA
jgi:hypothetical protein